MCGFPTSCLEIQLLALVGLDVMVYSVLRPIFLNQISGSLGRIKWTFRIAVGKFTGMIFVSLENACSPFRLGLLWGRPLFFCIGLCGEVLSCDLYNVY